MCVCGRGGGGGGGNMDRVGVRCWCVSFLVSFFFVVKYHSFELVVDTAAQIRFADILGQKSLVMN